MKFKGLTLVVASFGLFASIAPMTTARAAWQDNYRGTFRVRIKKNTPVTKIVFGKQSYMNHPGGTTTLRRGQVVNVTYTGHDGIVWQVQGKHFKMTKHYTYSANFSKHAFKVINQVY